MYNKLSIALGTVLAVGVAGVAGGAMAKVDGDTIILRSESSPSDITIRLVGIDAPETSKAKREPGQPYGQAATKHLAALILNKAITIRILIRL